MAEFQPDHLLVRAADIVSAYVIGNRIALRDLPVLIGAVHVRPRTVQAPTPTAAAPAALVPAVAIKKSITPDHLICLEDGRRLRSMKGYLHKRFGLTPDAYRAKWGLPPDYPMVAPSYAALRSNLAKHIGLGRTLRKGP